LHPAPTIRRRFKALVDAVRPKPINVLVIRDSGLSVADIAALGVRRISVGGALAFLLHGPVFTRRSANV